MFLSSCVPVKKLMYLQHDDKDLKHRDQIPKDTVLRTHVLKIREYRIQPLDLLNINFETIGRDDDEFDFLSRISPQNQLRGAGAQSNGGAVSVNSNGVLVSAEGEIEYAVLGKIKVGGLTLFQAQDSIKAIASKYLPDVVVRVRMLNFRYTLLGEVNGEGTVNSTNTRLTMMEAIGLGGGLGELADRANIKVIRQKGDSTEIFYVDLLKEDFLESPYFYVQQNDVIIVPPLRQRTFRKYFSSNLGYITTAISFTFLIITLSR